MMLDAIQEAKAGKPKRKIKTRKVLRPQRA